MSKTRVHSSRMCTTCSLTAFPGFLEGGGGGGGLPSLGDGSTFLVGGGTAQTPTQTTIEPIFVCVGVAVGQCECTINWDFITILPNGKMNIIPK